MEYAESNWHLNPQRMPKTLEFDLPADLLDGLQQEAQRSGRSVDEIIIEILDRNIHDYS